MSKKKKTTKSKGGKKGNKKPNLEFRLLDYLKSFPNKQFNHKQLFKKYMGPYDKGEIMGALNTLLQKGKVERTGATTIRLVKAKRGKKSNAQEMEGTLDMARNGYGYVICPDLEQDVFIPAKKLGHALHKDKVSFIVTHTGRTGRMEGEILGVIKRMQDHYVGRLEVQKHFAFLVPDSEKMHNDIYIPKEYLPKDIDTSKKVVVQIVDWPNDHDNPIGKVIEAIGNAGENEVEMKSILIESGFHLQFPDSVMKENDKIPETISEEEIAQRMDLRETTTFTIDPEDAKDFDDALSLRELEDGKYEVGVHIADVSHYVKPDTALDKEAYERATSVYLVDRVVPMLPEKISNVVCSLRPNEDKLAFSVLFTMNKKGEVLDSWYGRTVIHSDHRFTYRAAQDVLDGKTEGPLKEELTILHEIALKLRAERMKTGSIAFESQEVRFKLDENGKPLEVVVKEILETNELIEDYMLLANKFVSKFISKLPEKGQAPPNVFRVHGAPDMTKLEQFADFARKFGYTLKFTEDAGQIAETLNNLLKRVQDKPEATVLSQLAIRTMAKAYYTTKNIGHYGLAFDYYSHFTSPIRRYPDLLVHRILQHVITKQKPPYDKGTLEDMSTHCSLMERNAMNAERESVKYKQVEYLSDHIGEVFRGIISGVIGRGIFVELVDNKCEGFIPENKLGDYEMIYDEARLSLTDSDTGDVYQFGDPIIVRVVSTDLAKRQIELELAEEDELEAAD